jgi:hypothetical protein
MNEQLKLSQGERRMRQQVVKAGKDHAASTLARQVNPELFSLRTGQADPNVAAKLDGRLDTVMDKAEIRANEMQAIRDRMAREAQIEDAHIKEQLRSQDATNTATKIIDLPSLEEQQRAADLLDQFRKKEQVIPFPKIQNTIKKKKAIPE